MSHPYNNYARDKSNETFFRDEVFEILRTKP